MYGQDSFNTSFIQSPALSFPQINSSDYNEHLSINNIDSFCQIEIYQIISKYEIILRFWPLEIFVI